MTPTYCVALTWYRWQRSFKFTPVTLRHTFTIFPSKFLFFTLRLPNQQIIANKISVGIKGKDGSQVFVLLDYSHRLPYNDGRSKRSRSRSPVKVNEHLFGLRNIQL